jgi:hypothetical protein
MEQPAVKHLLMCWGQHSMACRHEQPAIKHHLVWCASTEWPASMEKPAVKHLLVCCACRREAERRGGGPGGARGGAPPSLGPLSFKQFLVTEVPDDVNPTQAQDMYDQYLTRHFGNQLRAKFEQEKGQKE